MNDILYLDHAASAPTREVAIRAYVEAAALTANPASVHAAGQRARERLESARSAIAAGLRTDPRRLTFTSGGTESTATVIAAVSSAWEAKHGQAGHIVTSNIEHSATLAPLRLLEKRGWRVDFLPVGQDATVSPAQLQAALAPDTALVTLQHLNNEVGSIFDTKSLAAIAAEAGVPYHCDAVQALGAVEFFPEEMNVSYASFSAHKWGGGRGVGLLYAKRGAEFGPLFVGGGQESGLRAGTQNTAGTAAAAAALTEALAEQAAFAEHTLTLRTQFENLLQDLEGLSWNHPPNGSGKIANLTLQNTDGEALLMNLDMAGVCASAGSACAAGTMQPSHVLLALGRAPEEARASLRFSWGLHNTPAEIERAAAAVRQAAAWSAL